ncbi:concanavalin A-like lectin/glucanase domain-containing protein [Microdochium bolleyi]|uniref:Concanavalin A-like lectin/glucanase domain-containing protein n=1 Tax=Microdochium bolleyi TaxID=196109 RepID=A0A136IU58_9PEZI|nr:concanavalin A-like lectin/glucanase domain-containing protein [Microdochium bolleyi]
MTGSRGRLVAACLIGSAALVSAAKVCDFECTTHASLNAPTLDNEFCANAWAPEPTGFQCLAVAKDGASFQADWHWTGGAPFAVHSFPHVNLRSARLPVKLDDIKTADMAVEWGMGPNATFPKGDTLGADEAALVATKAMATIAYDLWIDEDPDVASSASKAAYEIMIWLGKYGDAQPIASSYPSVPSGTLEVDGQGFTLYVGKNAVGQTVCSWVLDKGATKFKMDIVPLITELTKKKLIPAKAYLGGIHFGVEAFYASETIAFVAKDYTAVINDKNSTTTSSTASSTGTQTSKPTVVWSPVPTGPNGAPSAASPGVHSLSILHLCGSLILGWVAISAFSL